MSWPTRRTGSHLQIDGFRYDRSRLQPQAACTRLRVDDTGARRLRDNRKGVKRCTPASRFQESCERPSTQELDVDHRSRQSKLPDTRSLSFQPTIAPFFERLSTIKSVTHVAEHVLLMSLVYTVPLPESRICTFVNQPFHFRPTSIRAIKTASSLQPFTTESVHEKA